MKKYRYILFDLDGTLIYSHEGIFSCIRHALKEMGEPAPNEEQLKKCIGPTLMYSFSTYFGMTEKRAAEATKIYREQYAKTGVWENRPIEGAAECLKALKEKGYVLAMATSKPKFFADKIAERFGFSAYFSAQVGSGTDGSLPTKASVIKEAMRLLGADEKDCLMVGDRKHDVEGAREVGVDCAALTVGYAPQGEFEICKPKYVFENFEKLTAFLLQ